MSDSVKFVMMVRDGGNGIGRHITNYPNYYDTTTFRTKNMKERTKKHPRIPLGLPTTINSTPVNVTVLGNTAPQEAKPNESVKVDVVEDSTPITEDSTLEPKHIEKPVREEDTDWKLKNRCPVCNSHKTRYRSKTKDMICERCGNLWKPKEGD